MNHFNATVKDGKLINTRRGLEVSRQKFNGISFVNSCPQSSTTVIQPLKTRDTDSFPGGNPTIEFVDGEHEPRQRSMAERQTAERPDVSFTLAVPERRKQRQRSVLKDYSSGGSSRASSRTPSIASSSGDYISFPTPVFRFDGRASTVHDFSLQLPLTMPATLSYGKPASLSQEDWQLFHLYWENMPKRIYPFENILTHNPVRAPELFLGG